MSHLSHSIFRDSKACRGVSFWNFQLLQFGNIPFMKIGYLWVWMPTQAPNFCHHTAHEKMRGNPKIKRKSEASQFPLDFLCVGGFSSEFFGCAEVARLGSIGWVFTHLRSSPNSPLCWTLSRWGSFTIFYRHRGVHCRLQIDCINTHCLLNITSWVRCWSTTSRAKIDWLLGWGLGRSFTHFLATVSLLNSPRNFSPQRSLPDRWVFGKDLIARSATFSL